jgi:biopolymer transport protein TolQ
MQVDLVQAVRTSDLMGLLCLLVLLGFSVLSWAVILQKSVQFRRAFAQTRRFARKCEASKGDLYSAVNYARQYPASPLATLLQEAYVEMELEGWFRDLPEHTEEQRARRVRENLEKVLSRSIESEMRHLENNLAFLSTTANVCPFIGLLGTVWGVLSAFQTVGNTGSATIQAIAPGVSTALITTVAGLLAAIPAVVAYNILASRVQNLGSRMESFANELTSILEKFALNQD